MQGGLHPDLKIDWHEKMLRGIKERFPAFIFTATPLPRSSPSRVQRAQYPRHHPPPERRRTRLHPGGGAEILDDEVRYKLPA